MLAEAENLLDRELLRGAYTARHPVFDDEEDEMAGELRLTLREIKANLGRSRALLASRPANPCSCAHSMYQVRRRGVRQMIE